MLLDHSKPNTFTERLNQQAFGFWLLVGAALFAFAQAVRLLILASGQKYFLNEKFAFSLDVAMPVMYGLYLIAMLFIGHYLWTHWQKLYVVSKLGFVMIVTGGVSNVIERLIAGRVTDYFFIAGGVLNLSDFYILIGIILIFIQRGYRES